MNLDFLFCVFFNFVDWWNFFNRFFDFCCVFLSFLLLSWKDIFKLVRLNEKFNFCWVFWEWLSQLLPLCLVCGNMFVRVYFVLVVCESFWHIFRQLIVFVFVGNETNWLDWPLVSFNSLSFVFVWIESRNDLLTRFDCLLNLIYCLCLDRV